MEHIKNSFSNVVVRNDLCYATTNRQVAVKKLCKLVELILVIGAPNSSNCNRLKEVAESQGINAYLINGPGELDKEWLRDIENVGITSGASTPDELVNSVVAEIGADEVTVMDGVEEDVNFVLPPEIA